MLRNFELVGAPHQEPDGTWYEKGDVIASEVDLADKWKGKFQESPKKPFRKAGDPEVIPKSTVVNKRTPVSDEDAHLSEDEEVETEDGEAAEGEAAAESEEESDVTDRFALAEKKKVTVTKVGKWYTVKDARGKAVHEPMAKSKVSAFLKTYRP